MKNIILLLILALFTNLINAQEKKEYYDNGQLKSIENYVDTLEHGSFIYYYENGIISGEGTMKNGELEGAYSEYNKKGQLRKRDDSDHEFYQYEYNEFGISKIEKIRKKKNIVMEYTLFIYDKNGILKSKKEFARMDKLRNEFIYEYK